MAIVISGETQQLSLMIFEQMTVLMFGIFTCVRPSPRPVLSPLPRGDSEMLHAARSTLALDTEYCCSGPRRWYMTLSFPRGEGRLLFRKARFGLVHVSRRSPSRSGLFLPTSRSWC